jgi:peptidoglycan/LPS O-acetylase OafA/YrhL
MTKGVHMTPVATLKIRKSLSTYLDLLRFTAALLVVLEHAVLLGVLPPMGVLTQLSHESVMVFFVLSGLVIGASSLSPDMTAGEYIASRAARIYCVALPALVCCYGFVSIVGGGTTHGLPVGPFASSFFFLDGAWFNYAEVPLNGPYWSLCYEVWYYAFWGALCFVRRPSIRLLAAGLVLAAMGPAFAALIGTWLLGAAIASHGDRMVSALRRSPRWVGPCLFAGSVAGIVLIASSHLQEDVRQLLIARIHGWWRMRGSEYVVTDYVIGILVAIHLVSALWVFGEGRRLYDSRAGRAIRYCAGFTFTLYLFHYPILLALKAVRGSQPPSLTGGLGVIAMTLAGVWVVAFGTERQLPRWKQMARAVVARASRVDLMSGSSPIDVSQARAR